MEGLIFYWVSWTAWVLLTFIVKKENQYRSTLSAVILINIILSNHHYSFRNFDFNLGGLFILLLSYAALYKENWKALSYFFISSFIVTTAYASFHLFELFDPIWLIFKKEWMIGICIGYLAILLQKSIKRRILVVVSGTMQGELLYSYILSKYQFPYQIGSFAYLDACALTLSLIMAWGCAEYIGHYLENHFHFIEKGKQKSS